jgi:hypothetical protein
LTSNPRVTMKDDAVEYIAEHKLPRWHYKVRWKD